MGPLIPTPSTPAACSQRKPSAAAGNSLSAAIEARTIRLDAGAYVYPAGRGLTQAERRTIAHTMADIAGRLAQPVPEDGGQIVAWVAGQVHTSFKARDVSATKQQTYDGFLIALPGRSEPAVREAVRRLLRDEAPPELSRTFAPTPAEVSKLTRSIESEWRLEHDRLAWLVSLPEVELPEPEPQPTPEEMERVRERVRRLTAGAASRRGLPPIESTGARARVAEATKAMKQARALSETSAHE